MRYTASAIKYNFKNFFYVFPLVILPAFFLSFTVAREDILAIAQKIAAGAFGSITFVEIFQAVSIFNFASWETALAGFLGVGALIVCVALLMAFTDKHMRFGKRTFNGLLGKLNDNLLSTFGFTMLLLAIYELWTLLFSALLLLVFRLPVGAVYAVAPIVVAAAHVALLYLLAIFYLWLPCMQITGFRTFEALRYSHLLCEPIQWRITISQLLSLVFSEICIVLAVLYLPDIPAVSIAGTTALYAYMILQFCVRMQIVYFDREQIERADLKPYYNVQ